MRKKALKTAQTSKKAKGLNNLIVVIETWITASQNQWFIKQNKIIPAWNTCSKRAEKTKKVKQAKREKNHEKVRDYTQKMTLKG